MSPGRFRSSSTTAGSKARPRAGPLPLGRHGFGDVVSTAPGAGGRRSGEEPRRLRRSGRGRALSHRLGLARPVRSAPLLVRTSRAGRRGRQSRSANRRAEGSDSAPKSQVADDDPAASHPKRPCATASRTSRSSPLDADLVDGLGGFGLACLSCLEAAAGAQEGTRGRSDPGPEICLKTSRHVVPRCGSRHPVSVTIRSSRLPSGPPRSQLSSELADVHVDVAVPRPGTPRPRRRAAGGPWSRGGPDRSSRTRRISNSRGVRSTRLTVDRAPSWRAASKVDAARPGSDPAASAAGPAARRRATREAGVELVHPERLGHVVVRAVLQGLDLLALLVAAGQDDDRRRGLPPDLADHRRGRPRPAAQGRAGPGPAGGLPSAPAPSRASAASSTR